MNRNVRVKAFIGHADQIDELCHFLRHNGVVSADVAWTTQASNEVIKVNLKDYGEAVMLGSVYAAEKNFNKVIIVSLANQKLDQVADTANYARYKMHIKNSIESERE